MSSGSVSYTHLDVYKRQDRGYLAIQGFFIRSGKLLERQLSLTPLYGDPEEELISFLMQYYQNHPLPQEVIVPLELDIEALQEVITCKLIQPIKGYRKKLLDMASNNAKTNLLQKFEVMERQNDCLLYTSRCV